MYVSRANQVTSALKGKVVLAFQSEGQESEEDFMTKILMVQAKGVILASKRSDSIEVSIDIPMLYVDFEHGSAMLKYIGSTRYLLKPPLLLLYCCLTF